MRSSWRLVARAVALATVVAAIGTATLGSAPRSVAAQGTGDATATRIQLFVPFGPDGLAPGIEVRGRETFQGNPAVAGGSCQTGSILTARPDAWRCGTADPCFQDLGGHEPALACAVTPWSDRVELLTVAAPLPENERRQFDPSTTPPWAMELANGVQCVKGGGTATIIQGVGFPYSCQGPNGFSHAGPPDRNAALWTVQQAASDGQTILPDAADVLVAWY